MIPDELVRVRPVLNVTFAGALKLGGEFEGVEGPLQEAERLLETATGDREWHRRSAGQRADVNQRVNGFGLRITKRRRA